jgi:rod shape-determining protein MreC
VLPRRFDQARPFLTLGIILLAWVFLPLGVKVFTRATFFEIQAPLTVADSYVRDLQNFWSNKANSKEALLKAGQQVSGLIARYEYATQQNSYLEGEILRLENLLKIPSMPDFRFEPARVARRDFSAWWQRIIIRKGANYGITVGAPVVFAGGVVGRVTEVHRYTAVVDLITSPTLRLAAAVSGDTRPISYQGGLNSSFTSPSGTVDFVPLDLYATPAVPLRLVTSGLGGVFPPGLGIGEITRLEPSADGLFKSGEVRLDQRLGNLTEVTVLIPLNPEE